MIKTIASIFITLAVIAALSCFEMYYIHTSFDKFHDILDGLQSKIQLQLATVEDGKTAQRFWNAKKEYLHVWIPHTALVEIDLQMDETVGLLSVGDLETASTKIEVLLGLSKHVPENYTINFDNIF